MIKQYLLLLAGANWVGKSTTILNILLIVEYLSLRTLPELLRNAYMV